MYYTVKSTDSADGFLVKADSVKISKFIPFDHHYVFENCKLLAGHGYDRTRETEIVPIIGTDKVKDGYAEARFSPSVSSYRVKPLKFESDEDAILFFEMRC